VGGGVGRLGSSMYGEMSSSICSDLGGGENKRNKKREEIQ
jgi:hypothetical protein